MLTCRNIRYWICMMWWNWKTESNLKRYRLLLWRRWKHVVYAEVGLQLANGFFLIILFSSNQLIFWSIKSLADSIKEKCPKGTFSDCLFCLTNTLKLKDIQFTTIPLHVEKVGPSNIWHVAWKRLNNSARSIVSALNWSVQYNYVYVSPLCH